MTLTLPTTLEIVLGSQSTTLRIRQDRARVMALTLRWVRSCPGGWAVEELDHALAALEEESMP